MRMVLRRLSLAVFMFTAAASLARASFVTVVRYPRGAFLHWTPRRSFFGTSSGCAVQRVPASMSASTRVNYSRRKRWWQSSAASLVTAPSTKTTSSSTARFLSGTGSAASDAASSVVDTCQRKIRDALNAVEVKVTGALVCGDTKEFYSPRRARPGARRVRSLSGRSGTPPIARAGVLTD
jgi:hypothetical protein